MKALVVEDNANIGELIAENYFRYRKHECMLVRTLAGALALKDMDFDIIVLSLNLPDSQSWETLVPVRATFPKARIMVLIGSVLSGDITKARNLGADYVLQKSIVNFRSFDEAVENMLAKSKHPTIDKAAEIISMTDSSINIIKTLGSQILKAKALT